MNTAPATKTLTETGSVTPIQVPLPLPALNKSKTAPTDTPPTPVATPRSVPTMAVNSTDYNAHIILMNIQNLQTELDVVTQQCREAYQAYLPEYHQPGYQHPICINNSINNKTTSSGSSSSTSTRVTKDDARCSIVPLAVAGHAGMLYPYSTSSTSDSTTTTSTTSDSSSCSRSSKHMLQAPLHSSSQPPVVLTATSSEKPQKQPVLQPQPPPIHINNWPVNRAWNNRYKRKWSLVDTNAEAEEVGRAAAQTYTENAVAATSVWTSIIDTDDSPTTTTVSFIPLTEVVAKLALFAKDIAGDFHFERCRVLGFHTITSAPKTTKTTAITTTAVCDDDSTHNRCYHHRHHHHLWTLQCRQQIQELRLRIKLTNQLVIFLRNQLPQEIEPSTESHQPQDTKQTKQIIQQYDNISSRNSSINTKIWLFHQQVNVLMSTDYPLFALF